MKRALAAALSAALTLGASAPAAAFQTEKIFRAAAVGGPAVASEVVSSQVFVHFSPSANKAAIISSIGGTVIQDYPNLGWTLISLSTGMAVATAVGALSLQPGVLAADGNHVYKPNKVPSDPQYTNQYALKNIDAPDAWDLETGSTNKVTVAVIDSGIDHNTADVAGKLAGTSQAFDSGTGAQSVDNPPNAVCSHGTETSSVAAAVTNNAVGIAGVSWGAQLISLRVFNADVNCNGPAADCNCLTSDQPIINAVNYAVTQQNSVALGHVVINMSLGGAGACSGAMQAALNAAVTAGIPVVVSAGNDSGAVNSPANCATSASGTGIIPVTASDENDTIAWFSSRGPEVAANGVMAPGVDVTVDKPGGTFPKVDGTSFSAPHVAGVAALMLSARPTLSAKQVQSLLRQGADNTGVATAGNNTGTGRLNARRAVKLAVSGSESSDLETKLIAYPNPFRMNNDPFVRINIPSGVQSSDRKVSIYTAAGELVTTVAGLIWDGTNFHGQKVASGTYVIVAKIGSTVLRGHVAVIR